MPPEAPVATPPAPPVPDPTILTVPPTPAPKPPEAVVYPDVKPADPAAPKPPEKPADPAAVTPPATPTPETKPPTELAKPGDPVSPKPAPVDYDLKPPEGSLVSADEAKALTERAKKAGLSKEQAEGLLQERIDASQSLMKRQNIAMGEARKQWMEEAKADPVFGGDKFAESAEKARRVIDRFASPELKKMLDETGFGNNPYVFRFVASIASAFSEDQLVRGQTGASEGKKSREEILYGKTTPGEQAA